MTAYFCYPRLVGVIHTIMKCQPESNHLGQVIRFKRTSVVSLYISSRYRYSEVSVFPC